MTSQTARADRVTLLRALRRLFWFQLKLALDALRDLLFSPVSFVAFFLDVLFRPERSRSFTHRLMALGRRSDRLINLFEEYSDAGDYTVDRTFAEVESAVLRAAEQRAAGNSEGGAASRPPEGPEPR
ncbi:MAG: hypothetical protein V2J89_08380 [Halieaceae bacterium]|jgi:hypothetical protein|nr:hypothetical protein [Halieaceae bacterium]